MLCLYNFVFNFFFVSVVIFPSCGPRKRLFDKACLCFRLVCASGWFVLSVGLCDWKIRNVHPILTVMFKNILRTYEAELYTLFQKPGTSMESRRCGQDKRIFFCPVHNASTPCSLQAFGIRCIKTFSLSPKVRRSYKERVYRWSHWISFNRCLLVVRSVKCLSIKFLGSTILTCCSLMAREAGGGKSWTLPRGSASMRRNANSSHSLLEFLP